MRALENDVMMYDMGKQLSLQLQVYKNGVSFPTPRYILLFMHTTLDLARFYDEDPLGFSIKQNQSR